MDIGSQSGWTAASSSPASSKISADGSSTRSARGTTLPGPDGQKYVRRRGNYFAMCCAAFLLSLTHVSAQRLGKRLGQGSFGSVVEAFNEETSERVAVKQLSLNVDDDRAQENVTVSKFLAEPRCTVCM